MRSWPQPALLLAALLVIGMNLGQAHASDPDFNPTANTGALKAQIETGGSYDAHSGNATRVIPDLRVPNALGVYGLDFVRYWNSLRDDRNRGNLEDHPEPQPVPNQPSDFGSPGWSHSWSWRADYEAYGEETEWEDSYPCPKRTIHTMLITITFPDGHATKYNIVRNFDCLPTSEAGPPFSPAEASWPATGPVHDHLDRMAPDGSNFWLFRADGGSVHFVEDSTWGYQARTVVDRYGFRTTLSYDTYNHLTQVEQEGGRLLTLIWNGGVIDRVESGGTAGVQAVDYDYEGGLLTKVTYYNDPAPGQTNSSSYTYLTVTPPAGFMPTGPLLETADDPRFEGSMRSIRYTYQGSGCTPLGRPAPNVPYQGARFDDLYASPTAIKKEKSLETGATVSEFAIGCFDGTRTEYNGFGAFRQFFFGRSAHGPGSFSIQGYQLAKLTDFTTVYPLPAELPFEWQNYHDGHPRQIWDGRNTLTETLYQDGSGFPSEIRYTGADDSIEYYDRINRGSSAQQDFNLVPNPYHHWLFSKRMVSDTDGRDHTTTYIRDSRRRVTDIIHPDISWEHFEYNGYNQITSHRLASGGVVTYEYDGRNLLEREWNSVEERDNGIIYGYDSLGRVETISHSWSRAKGALWSVKMTYNGRHKVIREEYPSTDGGTIPFKTYEYTAYGDCRAITDEMNHRSEYTYDMYGRCTSYIEPLNAPDWNGSANPGVASRRWDWIYDRYFNDVRFDASAHTSKQWRVQVEPVFNEAGDRRLSAHKFDYNDRIIEEATGLIEKANGNWAATADTELRIYGYDENGNKNRFIDARGRLTEYEYDRRNRLVKTKETINTIPRTTETFYDTAGNKTLVKFPDQRTQRWLNYDAFGQAWHFIDERANPTDLTYQWGPMKKLDTVTTYRTRDEASGGGLEPQVTNFDYDGLGRLNWTFFPDGSSELTAYEREQVSAFKTRKNQTKKIYYDARGREDYHTWDDDAAPGIDRIWDNANRLTSISNAVSTIEYTYDAAAQVRTERNTISGSGGTAQTTYYRYPDGAMAHVGYPGGVWVRHDYTARGQLKRAYDNTGGYWKIPVEYTYLADGKVDYQDSWPGIRTDWDYDGRGFIEFVRHHNPSSSQEYSRRNYYRDDRDRIIAFQKGSGNPANPMEDGRGDHYWYDDEGQLTDAYYGAVDPRTDPHNPVRRDEFTYDELGNRMGENHLANRGGLTFERKNNGLNQYGGWWNYSFIRYDDDIGGTWGAPRAANGVLMQDGWITSGFNALNQPMYIWSANVGWTNFGYDPVGRCVKRWKEGGAPTYLYYDGWNLIEEGANAGNTARLYLHGGRVDEIVASYDAATDIKAYHYYDASGHCTLLVHWQGHILEQYYYDAFGYPYFYGASGNWLGYSPHGNRFLFTGREWLSELKLYDYRNRLYQPELGRFMQPDPKQFGAGDYNLYRYCHNDPINKSDPFGLVPPGEGLLDLPRKTLQEMKEAMKDNIRRTLTEKSPDGPGGKPRPQEHRTTAYDNGKGERRTSSETGYHKNNQPMTDLPKNPFGKEPATPAWDTHSHISGSGKPINNDRPAADSMRVPSGIQSATGGPLYIYVPSATRGGEGGLFRVEGSRLINDATGQEAPH